jgi:hypothetical protein
MASQDSKSKTFTEATAIKQLSSHQYVADFPDDWCIGTGKSPKGIANNHR